MRIDHRTRRAPIRWDTEFGRWIADFGVSRLVAAFADDPDLRITRGAVYEWLRGHTPRPNRAMALVRLSCGRLSLQAIYNHGRELKGGLRNRNGDHDTDRDHDRACRRGPSTAEGRAEKRCQKA